MAARNSWWCGQGGLCDVGARICEWRRKTDTSRAAAGGGGRGKPPRMIFREGEREREGGRGRGRGRGQASAHGPLGLHELGVTRVPDARRGPKLHGVSIVFLRLTRKKLSVKSGRKTPSSLHYH
jgi:hypothetical protein